MKIEYVKREQIAENIFSFYFKSPTRFRFIPGQYVDIHIPHDKTDERGHTRTMTISSTPNEPYLVFTTKLSLTDKISSYKNSLNILKPGQIITITHPMGDFVLPKDKSIPLIFIAGGIGAAPFRSMVKHLIDTKESRNVVLYYTVREPNEYAFLDVFENLGQHFHKESGVHLDLRTILKNSPPNPTPYIFLSGPKPMILNYNNELLSVLGVDQRNIVLDYFPGYDSL